MSVGQASGLALAAAAEVGLRGVPVHLERGQAGPGRLRRGHQGPDAADGGQRARSARGAPARPTWPTPWPWPSAISPPSRCAGLGRAVPAVGLTGRDGLVIGCWAGSPRGTRPPGDGRGGRRGRGRRLPGGGDRPATAAGLGPVRRPRCSSTCTPMCARTPSSSTASPTTTSGDASRPCSGRTGSVRPWPWPSSRRSPRPPCRPPCSKTTSTLCAPSPVSGRKTAARLLST